MLGRAPATGAARLARLSSAAAVRGSGRPSAVAAMIARTAFRSPRTRARAPRSAPSSSRFRPSADASAAAHRSYSATSATMSCSSASTIATVLAMSSAGSWPSHSQVICSIRPPVFARTSHAHARVSPRATPQRRERPRRRRALGREAIDARARQPRGLVVRAVVVLDRGEHHAERRRAAGVCRRSPARSGTAQAGDPGRARAARRRSPRLDRARHVRPPPAPAER